MVSQVKTERDELIETLETLLDENTLSGVLDALSEVCNLKATHLLENWQDKGAAKAWLRAQAQIDRASQRIAVD